MVQITPKEAVAGSLILIVLMCNPLPWERMPPKYFLVLGLSMAAGYAWATGNWLGPSILLSLASLIVFFRQRNRKP